DGTDDVASPGDTGSLDGSSNEGALASAPFLWDQLQDFQAATDVAVWNFAVGCMREKGFDLMPWTVPPSSSVIETGLPQDADPSRGFRMPPPAVQPEPEPEFSSEPDFLAALHGTIVETRQIDVDGVTSFEVMQSDGCLGRGQVEVLGGGSGPDGYLSMMETSLLLNHLLVDFSQRVMALPATRQLMSEWSECMQSAGYSFGTPLEAWNHD